MGFRFVSAECVWNKSNRTFIGQSSVKLAALSDHDSVSSGQGGHQIPGQQHYA